jgi:hypothetical protein
MSAGNSGLQALSPGVTQADPVVTLTLKGNQYRLVYDLGSLIGIFEDTTVNFIEGFTVDARTFANPSFLRDVLYHGLILNHPDVTKKELVHLVSIADLPHVVESMLEALMLALPRERAGGGEGKDSPEASAGVPPDPPPPPQTLS